jgi:methionyl-tRNA formyltransferase
VRVVIVSMAAGVVANYVHLLAELGHETAGVLTMRNRRRPETAGRVVAGVPDGVDAVVVGSAHRVAPLLRSYEADVGLCGGWGWKLGADALSATRLGIVNGHPSLLPRWRGPNPFGWTLRAGDPEAGYTFHFMDEGFDTGPILAQGSVPLSADDSMTTLREHVRGLEKELLPQALTRVASGDIGDPQSDDGATYASVYEDAFAEIDWTRPAREVHNQIRCWFTPTVSGIMGPLTTLDGERVRVVEARIADADASAAPGEIVGRDADGLLVQCGDGPIRDLRTEPVPRD